MSNETSFNWGGLLDRIDAGRVIPIVGPELLVIQHEGREVSLYRHLAELLAAQFGVRFEDLPSDRQQLLDDDPFHYVVDRIIEMHGTRDDLNVWINEIMTHTPLPTPKPLRKLARIRSFNLYVTLSFDALLAQAINQERFGGGANTQVLAFTPTEVKDLEREESSQRPTVYHLLGQMSSWRRYVITEEDTLEFFCSLFDRENRPELLFDELRHKDLLIIGCSFPDWLGRFFMRVAKGGPLSNPRQCREFLADRKLDRNRDFVMFLQNFSSEWTKLYRAGGAIEFVDELFTKYESRHPSDEAGCQPPKATRLSITEKGAPSIFISYCSQDQEAAEKIRDALAAVQLKVWFDKGQLEGGDEFERKIQRAVRESVVFVPIISMNTESDLASFFRREWGWALDRAQDFTGSPLRFIVPVTIDLTRAQTATAVPDEFKELQWEELPEGDTEGAFVELVKSCVRKFAKRDKGRV